MAMNFHASAGMRPDKAYPRMVAQRLFHFGQIERITLTLRGDIAVHQHRQIILRGQRIDPVHGLAVGPRWFTMDQRCQIVVPGKYLAYSLPKAGIQLEHATDVGICVLVVRIEAG